MNRTVLALVLFSALEAFAGAAYYDADDPDPKALTYPDPSLQATLQQELSRKKVSTKNATTGATDVTKFSRVEKLALLYAVGTKPGAEFDALIEDGGQFTPIEVLWDADVLSFKTGAPRASIYGKASSKEDIQKKYGIGPFVDSGASWDNDSLYVVETALSTLTKEELTGVAGLPFHRMVSDPNKKIVRGTAVAMYVPEKGQIELYSYGLNADKRKFFGSVDKPMPSSVSSVIHECGHAISRKSARGSRDDAVKLKAEYDELNSKAVAEKKKYDEDRAAFKRAPSAALKKAVEDRGVVLKQLIAEISEKLKQFEAVSKSMTTNERSGSAMENAFAAKLPVKDSPTVYGRTSLAESFADSLALYKLDKPAFDRAAPGVSAWFESPAYANLVLGK